MANKMYKVVAEELKKEEEDIVEPDVELSDRDNKIGDFLPTNYIEIDDFLKFISFHFQNLYYFTRKKI